MLVLSRRKHEEVVCDIGRGDQLVVSVVEIRGDKVRLGFEAPKWLPIHRREIWLQIRAGDTPEADSPAA